MSKKLLILNGSTRRKKTSYSFGRTMKILAEQSGNTAEIIHIYDFFDGKSDIATAVEKISESDAIALVAPLYVDTLPYPNIWFFEQLYAKHKEKLAGKRFFAVGQCGFPDVTRLEPMLNTCRLFANASGMTWIGGLGYGGGAMLDGKHLEDIGKGGQKITVGLKLAVASAFGKDPIPSKAQKLLTLKIPKILFRPLAAFLNRASVKKALEYGTNVRSKPYLNI